jgi:hypothetical protein
MYKKVFFILSALLLFITVSTQAKLIAYYPMDEGEGTVVKDVSGNGHDGTIMGATTWVDGHPGMGKALLFSGAGTSKVSLGTWNNVGSYNLATNTGTMTVAFWIKETSVPTTWAQPISKRSHWNTDGMMWHVEVLFRNGYFRFASSSSGNLDKPTPLTMNEWTHVAITVDTPGPAIMYINGVEVSRLNIFKFSSGVNIDICIGANANNRYGFPGIVDDVQFYDTALTAAEIPELMKGVSLNTASSPYPADTAMDIPLDAAMTWKAGQSDRTHNVYIGKVFKDVNEGTVPTAASLTEASYVPADLAYGTTYYWRIDEVDASPIQSKIYKGKTWNFTTEYYSYPIDSDRIIATASSQVLTSMGPEKTIDRSGLVDGASIYPMDDMHDVGFNNMWLSSDTDAGPVWIQYMFDKTYLMDKLMVWNFNYGPFLYQLGIKDVSIEYTIDGQTWKAINGSFELQQAHGNSTYQCNNDIDLGQLSAKGLRLKPKTNFLDGAIPSYGLSEVLLMQIPTYATTPSPKDGASNVAVDEELRWAVGREATSHKVYLSTDPNAVLKGTATVYTVSDALYKLDVDMGKTYYWRVDEVAGSTTWKNDSHHDIWSFSTPDYLIVDDIERYPNTRDAANADQIYLVWTGGFNTTNNGAQLGYQSGNPLPTTNVHGGTKAVPLNYDNTGTKTMSEISIDPAKLLIGRDWTKGGAKTLVFWFNGAVTNNPTTDRLYIKVGTQKVVYPGAANDISRSRWIQWNIDLATLGKLSNVTNFTIGLERTGLTGGKGAILIDDIRLYREAPVPATWQWIEAETASSITPSFAVKTEVTGYSGTGYIGKANTTGDNTTPPTVDANAIITFKVPTTGKYAIDMRYYSYTVGGNSNGFWVKMMAGTTVVSPERMTGTGHVTVNDNWIQSDNMTTNGTGFGWDTVRSSDSNVDIVWTLTAGVTYSFKIGNRDDGTMLDAIMVWKYN